MSIGFGLERLGLLTLKYPRAVAVIVLAFMGLCVSQLPRASVDGDLMRVYRNSGEQYERYMALQDSFGTFEQDAYILVDSPNLTDPQVLETLRDLAFDIELNEFAAGTLSPFSLRQPTTDGSTAPAVPEGMESREEVAAELGRLRADDPIMQNLIVEDLTGIVMIMFPESELTRADGGRAMIASLRELIAPYQTGDINVELTGSPVWSTELLDASLEDQMVFTVYGFVIGVLIALLSFRSIWGAALSALTPFVAVILTSGSIIMVFGAFTFLTNIVTTLVLVIAFAESMFFCLTWIRLWREGMDPNEAVRETVLRVSPACALAALTTMIAFGSLGLTQGQGVLEFALAGAFSMAVVYVTLVTFLPLALLLSVRLGFNEPRRPSAVLTAPLPIAFGISKRFARPLAIAGIAGTALLFIPHFMLEPRFDFQDFLPADSTALEVAAEIDEGVGGVSPIYIRVPLPDQVALDTDDFDISDEAFARIGAVHAILEDELGEGKVISGASFTHYEDSGFTRAEIFNAVGPFLRARFVTDDGAQALVTGFLPTMVETSELQQLVATVDSRLAEEEIEGAEVAGFRVLTSFASSDMIRSLQQGLGFAVVVSVFVIGIAFRDWRIALISFIPNILPILGTELFLFVTDAGLQLTTVFALTIAFGIALDDTIHFLANYARARKAGIDNDEAIRRALERVGPAIIATTLILCAGTFIVIFSTLPPVALFGTLTVLTLLLALFGDLLILPAIMLAGGRFLNGSRRRQ